MQGLFPYKSSWRVISNLERAATRKPQLAPLLVVEHAVKKSEIVFIAHEAVRLVQGDLDSRFHCAPRVPPT